MSKPNRNYDPRRLIALFWLLAIVLGAVQALDTRGTFMDPDGIAYLDIGDAYFRGDWNTALNGLWPPLYSWLLGLVMFILKPSPFWEFSVVRVVNFLIYLTALVCFHFFLRELIRYHQRRMARVSSEGGMILPEWAWLTLGYSLFIWSSLSLITILEDSPDMGVAALFYLASGILLRMRMGFFNWRSFVLLGVVLGLGYLAKSFMLQLALIFLGVTLLSLGNFRKAIPRVLVTLVIFLLIQSPFILALSMAKGHLTFRDSGRLHYSFMVNGIPHLHWQGNNLVGYGTPKHPTRKIFDLPAIYEFGTPIGGSYPPWHDPIYWNEGAVPHFRLGDQLNRLASSASLYFDIFFRSLGGLIVGCFVLYFTSRRRWLCVKDIAEHWSLLMPPIAILGALALVMVEPSHTGPFVVMIWMGILSGVRLPESQESKRLVSYVTIAMVTVVMITASFPVALQANSTFRDMIRGRYHPCGYTPWEVADGLSKMGIRPGAKVALMGNGLRNSWPRLARVQIVAEVPLGEVNSFWAADSLTKSQVIKAFAKTGAVIIVAETLPHSVSTSDWLRIGNTNYYAHLLPKPVDW